MTNYGDEIRRNRFSAGLTVKQLSQRSGVCADVVDKIEKGSLNVEVTALVAVLETIGGDVLEVLRTLNQTQPCSELASELASELRGHAAFLNRMERQRVGVQWRMQKTRSVVRRLKERRQILSVERDRLIETVRVQMKSTGILAECLVPADCLR